MRIFTLPAVFLATVLSTVACDKSAADAKREADEATNQAQKTAEQGARKVGETAREADKALGEAENKVAQAKAEADRVAARERIELRERMQKELAAINAKIATLEVESKTAKADVRAEKDKALVKLRGTRDALTKHLAEMDKVLDGEWVGFKQRVERELNEAPKS